MKRIVVISDSAPGELRVPHEAIMLLADQLEKLARANIAKRSGMETDKIYDRSQQEGITMHSLKLAPGNQAIRIGGQA